jgi:hypothetical protein
VVPRPIPMDKLFDVDVDDAIWEDVGLSESDGVADVPLWLSDDQVRTGIQGILLRDCCDKELKWLRYELSALEEWFQEEWDTLVIAISSTAGMDFMCLDLVIIDPSLCRYPFAFPTCGTKN